MRFSLYSELQLHPGKSPQQLYAEVLEQIVNADRLGYDCYAAIEHFFYPKFSISTNPTALFAAAAQLTRDIRFRTMLHVLPLHNPTVLAGVIHATDILTGGRYEWGVGRGHGWLPLPAGEPLDEHARPRYEEAVDLLLTALDNERFSFEGTYFNVGDSHVVPFVDKKYRVYLGGTSDRTYTLAAERGWGVAVPPLLPYAALEQQMDLYRESCAKRERSRHRGSTPVISTRTATRSARGATDQRLHPGQLLAAHRVAEGSGRGSRKAGYGFYAAGSWKGSRSAVREADRGRLRLGRHAAGHHRAHRSDAGDLRRHPGDRHHVNAGGPHWMAIKNQELASAVMPHFTEAPRPAQHLALRLIARDRRDVRQIAIAPSRRGGRLPRTLLDANPVVTFIVAAVAIALLARLVGGATEQLGGRVGSSAAGVVQSGLGNLPELFISLFALRQGLVGVVQAALVGSIVANSVLVLGIAFLVGGLRNGTQTFNSSRARIIATLSALAAAILSMPTLAHTFHTPAAAHGKTLSLICAGVLLVLFFVTLPGFLRGGEAPTRSRRAGRSP